MLTIIADWLNVLTLIADWLDLLTLIADWSSPTNPSTPSVASSLFAVASMTPGEIPTHGYSKKRVRNNNQNKDLTSISS